MAAPFFGWRAVAGAFVLAVFGWGLGFYGPPVATLVFVMAAIVQVLAILAFLWGRRRDTGPATEYEGPR